MIRCVCDRGAVDHSPVFAKDGSFTLRGEVRVGGRVTCSAFHRSDDDKSRFIYGPPVLGVWTEDPNAKTRMAIILDEALPASPAVMEALDALHQDDALKREPPLPPGTEYDLCRCRHARRLHEEPVGCFLCVCKAFEKEQRFLRRPKGREWAERMEKFLRPPEGPMEVM